MEDDAKRRGLWNNVLLKVVGYVVAGPMLLGIRLIGYWYLVRFGVLVSNRIGHFAANTEIYLCEKDAGINRPQKRYVDLFCMYEPICNSQLASMWRRILHVWPIWVLAPLIRINRLMPGGAKHEIGSNTQNDRDVHNLLDSTVPHLNFTSEEDAKGAAALLEMGIPLGAPFVCLIVRDKAYLDVHLPQNSRKHDFRNCNIQNYAPMAEELAKRGYYVIRMGAVVQESFKTSSSFVIDYASNGMRSEFMDIYLGAKCQFCITSGTGWDAVPGWLFRKPVVFTNYSVVGWISGYSEKFIFLPKRYHSVQMKRALSLSEILCSKAGYIMSSADFAPAGIELIENSPEELQDVVIEALERIHNTWVPREGEKILQDRFLIIFESNVINNYMGRPLHGKFRARVSSDFLSKNPGWLQ
jgi:putative glycosyltransferase (TIGR04372 family)